MGEMAKIEFLSADVQQGLLEEFSSVTLEAVTSTFGGVEKAHHVLEKSFGQAKAKEVHRPRRTGLGGSSPLVDELRNMAAGAIAQMLRGEQAQTWALDPCAARLRQLRRGLRQRWTRLSAPR